MARDKTTPIVAEMVANVLQIDVEAGAQVQAGDTVVLLESMKMEIPVITETSGTVLQIKVAVGDVIQEGDVLMILG